MCWSRWRSSPGWSIAPVPGWGENPNLTGPFYKAANGLGAPAISMGRSYGPVYVGTGEDAPKPTMAAKIMLGALVVLAGFTVFSFYKMAKSG